MLYGLPIKILVVKNNLCLLFKCLLLIICFFIESEEHIPFVCYLVRALLIMFTEQVIYTGLDTVFFSKYERMDEDFWKWIVDLKTVTINIHSKECPFCTKTSLDEMDHLMKVLAQMTICDRSFK